MSRSVAAGSAIPKHPTPEEVDPIVARTFLDAEWLRINLELHGQDTAWEAPLKTFVSARDASGELVGVAAFSIGNGIGYLQEIVVKKERRSQGIGNQLIGDFEERCRRRHCHKLYLEVEAANVRGQRFYERHGWQFECALRRHWRQQDIQMWAKWLDE